jgi:hypothetical protein
MTEIQTLLIFVLILYLLNDIKTKKAAKKITKKILPKKELFNVLNKNKKHTYKIDNKANIMKYGQIQYDVINYNNDIHYKYQDFDIIKKDKKLNLSENINELNKYNDLTKLNNKFDSSQNNFKKNIVTNLPCQQDIIYDTKFYQPSDADIYNPSDLSKINYKERKIQDVYDNIVNGNSAKTKNKKQIYDSTEFKSGASGLKTFKNVDWEYEGDDDGMSYDPNASIISAF